MKTFFFTCVICLAVGASGCRSQANAPIGGGQVQALAAHAFSISAAIGTSANTKQGSADKGISPAADAKQDGIQQ
jgi:hypothetical protein